LEELLDGGQFWWGFLAVGRKLGGGREAFRVVDILESALSAREGKGR